MTTAAQMRDRTALVTGGSTGIGAAVADALARAGAHLVLVARDATRLEQTADGIRDRHGVPVTTIALDLAEDGAVARLLDRLAGDGTEIELLVGSAGVASRGLVVDSDPVALRRLVDLNVGALTELTTAVVTRMVERGHGSVVSIASTGGFAPAPVLAAYAASKAYVLSFTQALWAETRRSGVRVVAVSPGPTRTPMNAATGRWGRRPEQVAATVLAALDGSGPSVVDGRANTLAATVLRLLPTRAVTALAMRVLAR
ncbi:dehydrogenase [Curtobacterium sp. MCJR17_055]|uniref:SDR family NAD(P)-dependent oxidoreductase n=1 Tax=unclassified Curtobacterium TaxID=257496 RepID=UPI000D8CD7CF|nr:MULTISPECIES: SDR family NAD(P)-dependent oxidoreductase [unclassified Curtobacterium]PYY37814.1 dehydrogenase [Curtobacterium sp. MCBD17_029]PYY56840.1 dehydrogenase [Curtobacterium sp. MCJR17_055]PYY62244.1 dehydrogenase [Curtobacterium sp. MCPF17_015]